MDKPYHILIVEDDDDISNMLRDLLCDSGYRTTAAFSGTEAVLHVRQQEFDLVLLDFMLPGMNGEQVLCELRKGKSMPVIALSAIDDGKTKVAMLKAGADDYVTKPFDTNELLARIEAQLRRATQLSGGSAAQAAPSTLTYKDIALDTATVEVTVAGNPVVLTKREYKILELLMSSPGRVFTKNNLFETVWNEEFFGDDNTVNVHISNIRGKLAKANPNEDYIQTVWGIGFKMA